MKRTIVLTLLMLIAPAVLELVRPTAERVWFVGSLALDEPAAQLPSPLVLARPPRFVDSWGSPRSGGRQHQGIDIFAPKGTPVVSTTRGVVTRVGSNRLGGLVVGVLGPGLEWHYYAHLNAFGDYREGDVVQPGDVLGYVGTTGNARGTPPHLHYGIYRHGAHNPYERLAAAAGSRHQTPSRIALRDSN